MSQSPDRFHDTLMTIPTREDTRRPDELRPTQLRPNYLLHAEGSVLIEVGRTRVICSASVEDRVPPFLRNSGKGWITAEYSMLPRATTTRSTRESTKGKVGGRTHEIQRLIGRSLRAVSKLEALGERSEGDPGGVRGDDRSGAAMGRNPLVDPPLDFELLGNRLDNPVTLTQQLEVVLDIANTQEGDIGRVHEGRWPGLESPGNGIGGNP